MKIMTKADFNNYGGKKRKKNYGGKTVRLIVLKEKLSFQTPNLEKACSIPIITKINTNDIR